ncbi:hypothetical protein GCM10010094_91220 [Streptomyces flaveus]|uniref:Resolvase/invertase-type recombinase catalytic domain-containing protein n=1 Tax=Streptomyces flaveus TaxID=66370 RepID=A0A917RMX1_9ACTN|nr:hypothetical protein GCM10010094_91220 [Streptomyces flaveus]
MKRTNSRQTLDEATTAGVANCSRDSEGIHPQTAYRWFREGRLPVPARRINQRTVLIEQSNGESVPEVGAGLYARVSSHDQRQDLDRQVARLSVWAALAAAAELGNGRS